VEEQVFACAHVDESKALVRQTLNRTFSHRHTIQTRLVLSNPEHSGTLPGLVREQCLRIGSTRTSGPFFRPRAVVRRIGIELCSRAFLSGGPAGMRTGMPDSALLSGRPPAVGKELDQKEVLLKRSRNQLAPGD
jgi:hypothetical protein